jgi:hypothetical protein
LPFNPNSGTRDQRFAAILRLDGITIVNVHLAHGQVLLRRQLRYVAAHLTGPAAIIGDMNVVGPVRLAAFADTGPRGTTHLAKASCRSAWTGASRAVSSAPAPQSSIAAGQTTGRF